MSSQIVRILYLQLFKRACIRQYFFLAFVTVGIHGRLFAQQTALMTANPAATPEAPQGVSAGDGDHEKYVLIRWEPAAGAQQYRVYRSTNAKAASMQEITKNWQKSTWFCDYGVQKGVDYYYAIISGNGVQKSGLSKPDKGFVRKDDVRAGVEDLTDVRGLTKSRPTFLLVSNVLPEKELAAAGDTVSLRINLQNIFEEPTPATQIRVFLSKDVILDWDDAELSKKAYSSFPASESIILREKIVLPKPLPAGNYDLIVVVSMEGDILHSKTGVGQLKIGD